MTKRPMALAVSAVLMLAAACGTSNNSGQGSVTSLPESSRSAASGSGASSPATSTPAISSPVMSPSRGSAGTGSSSSSAGSSPRGSGLAPAEQQQYCTSKAGQAQTRDAYWGTNGDEADWVTLAGSTSMCRFQSD